MLSELPLIVDLDTTLRRTSLVTEMALEFVHEQPLRFLTALKWLLHGKRALIRELGREMELDVAVLPYDQAVLRFIRAEREQGRRVVMLAADVDQRTAVRVAAHVALFDEVIAHSDNPEPSAGSRCDRLVRLFGDGGFDYVGHSRKDLPMWGAARHAYVFNARLGIERQAMAAGNVTAVFHDPQGGLRDWMRALRLHQWLKNLLIFVPLLAAHRYIESVPVAHAVLAFLCFGLCASSVYVTNDLMDLNADRHHARKRARPFAAGRLAVKYGLLAAPLLLIAAFALAAWQLPFPRTFGALATYYVLTLAYSLVLKRRMVIDVITLALLYTLRVVVGAVAIDVPLSFWLLAFSLFMFLSLALVKRYAELLPLQAAGNLDKVRGRGYYATDMQMVGSLGAAAGYMAVLVLALYINDPHTAQLYRHPQFIWLACPLLLIWISRTWMLAHRGSMHEDPVVFAFRDRTSLCIGALTALVFVAAI